MKKLLLLTLALLLTGAVAWAVPARPGVREHKQSDGTTVQLELRGDEWHHSLVTTDGLAVARTPNGDYCYRTAAGITQVVAHNPAMRNAAEQSFVAANAQSMTLSAIATPAQLKRAEQARLRAPRRAGKSQVPNTGTPKVPVILVQYPDKKMSNTKAKIKSGMTEKVKQYFKDQSNGLYTPQFELWGIYTLPSKRATYGGNDSSGDDVGVALMAGDAIDLAQKNAINWSDYDNDGDGECDVVIIIYAGVGEAQAGDDVPQSVWPCQWDLNSGQHYGQGSGQRTYGNVRINKFAVFDECYYEDEETGDNSTQLDGIGTFCHEFSHCLGLPDLYDTEDSMFGNHTFNAWSILDSGCYNANEFNGDAPVGYSAYEKSFLGWIDLQTPKVNTQYTLPIFNQKKASTDVAYKITSDLNDNEYYIVENRAQQGWDATIEDEGMMVTHVTYVPARWAANTVNSSGVTPSYPLCNIVRAAPTSDDDNEEEALFGEKVHSLTATTKPAALTLNMKADGSLASTEGGAGKLNKPLTEIKIGTGKKVTFWYCKGAAGPTLKVSDPTANLTTSLGYSTTYGGTVTGSNLTGEVKLALNDPSGVFALSRASIPADEANGATATNFAITFTPKANVPYNATCTLSSEGAKSVTLTLKGIVNADGQATPTLLAADATQVQSSSFSASWTAPANVASYSLQVNKRSTTVTPDPDPTGDQDDEGAITFTAGQDLGNQASGNQADQVTKSGVTIATTSGALKANPYKLDASSKLTISTAAGNIAKVKIYYTNNDWQTFSWATDWKRWADTAVFTPTSDKATTTITVGTNAALVTKVAVTLKAKSGTEPDPDPEPTTPADGTYTFTAGTDKGAKTSGTGTDEVTKNGITLTATKGALGGSVYTFASGGKLQVSCTNGKITKIVAHSPGGDYKPANTFSWSSGWTRTATEATFTSASGVSEASIGVASGKTAHVTSIEVTIGQGGGTVTPQPVSKTVTLKPATNKGTRSNLSSNTQTDKVTSGGITLAVVKGALGDGSVYKFYKSGTVTISSTVGNITKIEITTESAHPAKGLTASTGWTISGNTATFSGNTASTQLTANAWTNATQVAVTYTASAIAAPALKAASETGDADQRTITGITSNSYVVTGLTPGATYDYKVRATYTNGAISDWSNICTVTLPEEQKPAGQLGDVNGDGQINASDVTTLVSFILGTKPSPFVQDNADLNGDGSLNTSDVAALVNQILGI